MNSKQLNKLTELLLNAYTQGITNAVDLATFLANNGICFKKDIIRKCQALWDEED